MRFALCKLDMTSSPSSLPLYAQIKNDLRKRILDGTCAPHAQMPSESDLMESFKVSRITVRQALGDLQKEGLIFRIHGKGTFVCKQKAFQDIGRLQGFNEAMSRQGHETFNQVLGFRMLAATPEVADALRLAPLAQVCEIRRLRYLNREPLSVDVSYLPADIGMRLRNADLSTRDIFLILENDFGIGLGNADLRIESIGADAAMARDLRVEEGAPILRIERLTWSTDGSPIDYEHLFYRGDAFQYRVSIQRHATSPKPERA